MFRQNMRNIVPHNTVMDLNNVMILCKNLNGLHKLIHVNSCPDCYEQVSEVSIKPMEDACFLELEIGVCDRIYGR